MRDFAVVRGLFDSVVCRGEFTTFSHPEERNCRYDDIPELFRKYLQENKRSNEYSLLQGYVFPTHHCEAQSLMKFTIKEGDMIGVNKLKCLRLGECHESKDYSDVSGGTKMQAGQKGGCCRGRGEGPPGQILDHRGSVQRYQGV